MYNCCLFYIFTLSFTVFDLIYVIFVTGTVGLIFSALGILISGLVITKWKPQARPLAMWNVVVGAISVLGIISYAFLGCQEVQNSALIGDSE